MTARTIVAALRQHVLARHGIPETIHSDNATYFRGREFVAFCNTYNIKLSHSPVYNTRSNPVERSHRDLNDALRALISPSWDWEECLPDALLAIRAAMHSTTGYSPFVALYGRPPTLPSMLALGKIPPSDICILTSQPSYAIV